MQYKRVRKQHVCHLNLHSVKICILLQPIHSTSIRMSQFSQISGWATINMQKALNKEIKTYLPNGLHSLQINQPTTYKKVVLFLLLERAHIKLYPAALRSIKSDGIEI